MSRRHSAALRAANRVFHPRRKKKLGAWIVLTICVLATVAGAVVFAGCAPTGVQAEMTNQYMDRA